jgi:hypothetical protein
VSSHEARGSRYPTPCLGFTSADRCTSTDHAGDSGAALKPLSQPSPSGQIVALSRFDHSGSDVTHDSRTCGGSVCSM